MASTAAGRPNLLRWGFALGTVAVLSCAKPERSDRERPPAPVEVAPVDKGPISLRRTYSGTLEAPARFTVAPQVAGRLAHLAVDLADPVTRGQVVARIDDDEFRQLVAQARADLQVAKANLTQARSRLQIAGRDLDRIRKLRKRGVSSEAELDGAEATRLEREAEVEVAKAAAARARAALDAARTRLGYTRVTANWTGGNGRRFVAERMASPGSQVTEGTPLVSVVQLDPLLCVIFVSEREYTLLDVGQSAELRTDAHPGDAFEGTVQRVAPAFEPGSRQARVELEVGNASLALKPGMFVRASVRLKTVQDAWTVPLAAITTRDGQSGVFLVERTSGEPSLKVRWEPMQVGVRDGDRVQLLGVFSPGARVVTVGQQLLEDGSAITVPDDVPSQDRSNEPTSTDAS